MRPIAPVFAVASLSLALVPRVAAADAVPESAAPEPYEYAPARTGFQLGVRLAAEVPSGSLGGGANLSDLLGPRAHLTLDIGSKLNPYFFFGGYVGFSYGAEGGDFSAACAGTDAYGASLSCTSESADGGAVAVVTLLPNAFIDPWVGATIGYEIQGVSYGAVTGLFTGISPSLLAGFDFRVRNGEHRGVLSLGPYGGVTAQRYFTGSLSGETIDTGTEPFHAWYHLGLRITFPG